MRDHPVSQEAAAIAPVSDVAAEPGLVPSSPLTRLTQMNGNSQFGNVLQIYWMGWRSQISAKWRRWILMIACSWVRSELETEKMPTRHTSKQN